MRVPVVRYPRPSLVGHHEPRRPPRIGVVGVSGHDVCVQVRQRVAERQVVELGRLIRAFDAERYQAHLAREAARLLRSQVCRVGGVAPAPEDQRVSAGRSVAVEIRIRPPTGKDALAVGDLVWAALLARDAVDPASAVVPVSGPSPHRGAPVRADAGTQCPATSEVGTGGSAHRWTIRRRRVRRTLRASSARRPRCSGRIPSA